MDSKTLQLSNNLRERIPYNSHSIPLATCIDKFDDYFRNEWSCHWHDEFEFNVVIKGSAEFTIYDSQNQSVVSELHPGDGIFISTGCLHSARGIEPGTVTAGFALPITFFNTKLFENIYNNDILPIVNSGITHLFLNGTEPSDQPLLSSMEELSSITEGEKSYELHRIEMVCKIWRLLTARIMCDKQYLQAPLSNNAQEQRLKEMVSYIHANYSKHISIDDMAKSAGISRTECFRCFQTILRKSPTEYLIEYRLSMATMLLITTDRTLSDISSSCGFNSLSYFGKLFREQSGLTPKKHRELANANG